MAQVTDSQTENPNDTETYFKRGFKRIESKDYRGAIEDFNQILKIEPKNAYAYVGRGLSNFCLDEYQAAKTDFDKAIEITPDIPYAYYFRGLTNFALKDKPGAIADLQKSFTLFKKEGNQEFAQKATDALQKIQES
ncbi:tetratricopeptide repeat protein [Nostoc sp.]|uniref:tetratricopeptide repeat protein n=1 Tax=Nostoc sp. TaxID=1180 RepID=UPI002FFC9A91